MLQAFHGESPLIHLHQVARRVEQKCIIPEESPQVYRFLGNLHWIVIDDHSYYRVIDIDRVLPHASCKPRLILVIDKRTTLYEAKDNRPSRTTPYVPSFEIPLLSVAPPAPIG